MLCNYLTVGVMLLLAAFRMGWVRHRYFLPILSIHIVAAFFTLTPGLGGFVLAIALWVALTIGSGRQHLRKAALIAGPATAALSILVAAFTLREIPTSPFRLHFFGINIDPTQRLLTWQDALNTFIANPLFGQGLGLRVAEVKFLAPSGQMQMLTDAHNSFLSVAAQAGVPGLAAIMVLCFLVYRTARGGMRRGDHLITAMLIAFVSAFVVQGLTGSFEDARHLWLLIGLIYGRSKVEPETDGL
jgi:O-antigen ligase